MRVYPEVESPWTDFMPLSVKTSDTRFRAAASSGLNNVGGDEGGDSPCIDAAPCRFIDGFALLGRPGSGSFPSRGVSLNSIPEESDIG